MQLRYEEYSVISQERAKGSNVDEIRVPYDYAGHKRLHSEGTFIAYDQKMDTAQQIAEASQPVSSSLGFTALEGVSEDIGNNLPTADHFSA